MRISETVRKEIFKYLSIRYRKAESDYEKTIIDIIAYFCRKGINAGIRKQ